MRLLTSDGPISSSLLVEEPRDENDDNESGRLFGALLRRLNPASSLYEKGEFALSLPLLGENEQPEIVRPNKERQSKVTRADPPAEAKEKEASGKEEEDAIVTNERRQSNLSRPYFQFASPRQVSEALYGTSRQRWRETSLRELVDLSLLALQGIGSSIYAGELLDCQAASAGLDNASAVVHVVGHSIVAVANVVRCFEWFLLLRRLLNVGIEALLQSQDPSQLALAAAIRDVLFVHGASLSATRTAYAGGLEGALKDQPVPSLTDLLKSTALHRSTLWSLFSLVAPPQLTEAMQLLRGRAKAAALGSQSSSSSPSASSSAPTEDMDEGGARAIAVLFLHHPEAWVEAAASSVGWQLLDDIYSKVEKLRRVVTRRSDRHSSILSRGCNDDYFGFEAARSCEDKGEGEDEEGEGGDAEAQAHLAVASCLLRRVSMPLLDRLQRVMFHLDRDSGDAEDVGALLAVSPHSLWDAAHCADAREQSSDVAALYASQLWSSGRVALLYPEVYAAAQQLALPTPLSAGDIAHSRPLLSGAGQDLLNRCKQL
jgi:hypothetical protein